MSINIKKVIFASQKRAGQATTSTSTNDLLYLLSVVERGDQNSVITVDNTADFSSLVGQDSQIYYNKEDKKMYFVKNNTFFQTNGTIFYPLTGETTDPTDSIWRSTYAPASYVYETTPGAEGIRVAANDPITSMYRMFRSKTTFNNSDVSSWDVSTVTDMNQAFYGATAFNQDIGSWDVSNVTDMRDMFGNAAPSGVFNQNIGGWNTSSVTTMRNMFYNAAAFNQDISNWDTSLVGTANPGTVQDIDYMFRNALAFDQNLSSWDVSLIPSAPPSFATGATLFTPDEHPIWGTDGTGILYPLRNTATDPTFSTWRTANPTYLFLANVGIVMPAGSPITSMQQMFRDATTFNDADISSWDVSTVTNMVETFSFCSSFNQDLSSWDTSNVLTMSSMFSYCSSFNQDLSSWNVSSVTNTNSMFYEATAFNNGGAALNGNFTNTTNIVTDWNYMFFGASSFNQNISNLNTSGATDMRSMFQGAIAFDQDISSWDVSSVTDMINMFNGATAFDQNISSWNVLAASVAPGNSTPPTGFDLSTPASWTTEEKPQWGTDGTILLYPLTGETTDPTNATWRSTYAPATYVYDTTPGAEGIRVRENDPITNMTGMFEGASTFSNSDVAAWDVSTVTNMNSMFKDASAFGTFFGQDVVKHTLDNPNAYNLSSGDRFGQSIATSSTYTIVGAPREDDASGGQSGKAYIYNNATGALVHTLDNPNAYGTSTNDYFGTAVAITDTYAIVGAYLEDDAGGTESGKAYIYNTVTGALLHTLDNPNDYGLSQNDEFGYSVAISDTYAIVGAWREGSSAGLYAGKAYIFNNATGALVHTLINPNPYVFSTSDRFGWSVAITDTYTIVGAPYEDQLSSENPNTNDQNNAGKAYIYNTVTGALLHTLDNPNAYGSAPGDYFGWSIAMSENYAIVGNSYEDDAGGLSSGKAYIFSNASGALVHTLDNPNAYGTSASDRFGGPGLAVGITETYAIVGAYEEDDASGTQSGKAYIFNTVTGALVYTLDNPNPYGTSQDDYFGYSTGISDTYAVVGAFGEGDAGGTESGKAYIFDLTSSISGWDTGAVTNMTSMFNNATSFNQNLYAWNVSLIPSLPTDFATGATLFTTDKHPIWGTNGGTSYLVDPTYGTLVAYYNAYGYNNANGYELNAVASTDISALSPPYENRYAVDADFASIIAAGTTITYVFTGNFTTSVHRYAIADLLTCNVRAINTTTIGPSAFSNSSPGANTAGLQTHWHQETSGNTLSGSDYSFVALGDEIGDNLRNFSTHNIFVGPFPTSGVGQFTQGQGVTGSPKVAIYIV